MSKSNKHDHIVESISNTLEDHYGFITKKISRFKFYWNVLDLIADSVEGLWDNYDLVTGSCCIPNPASTELKQLQDKYKRDMDQADKDCAKLEKSLRRQGEDYEWELSALESQLRKARDL